MKLDKLMTAALLLSALAAVSCKKEKEPEPEPVDTTPAELVSVQFLAADNASLDEDFTIEGDGISPSMILRLPQGGVGQNYTATFKAGENSTIKVNDEAVGSNNKATFDATFPVDIVVTHNKSNLKSSYVLKIGKILQIVPTRNASFVEAADASHGTSIDVATNPSTGDVYIAYNRKLTVDGELEKNNNLSLAKWSGAGFDVVYSGFCNNATRQPMLADLKFDAKGDAYVVTYGEITASIASVKKYNGSGWTALGATEENPYGEIDKPNTISTAFGEIDLFFDKGNPSFVATGNTRNVNQRDAQRDYFNGSSWITAVGIPELPVYGTVPETEGATSTAGYFYRASSASTDEAAYVLTSSNYYGYYLYKVDNNNWSPLVKNFIPAEEKYGVPSNMNLRIGPDGKIYAFLAHSAASLMQVYRYNEEKATFETYGDPLAFTPGSSGAIKELSLLFIRPDGTFVVVRINSETSTPEFCILDENRQWTAWQSCSDAQQYSGFSGAMLPDGTIFCAYVSRTDGVYAIESFSVGLEPDIIPE